MNIIKLNESTLDMSSMNLEIDRIISKNNLTKKDNDFFTEVINCQIVTPEKAFEIAVNWLEITKTFMFTVIGGLGLFASQLLEEKNPCDAKLAVLQTAFSVISDDLNNCHPIFKNIAPTGPQGIHYNWWNNAVVAKLRPFVDQPIVITNHTKILLKKMRDFAGNIMGTAVQLRIVEAIASDIASSFLVLFSKVKYAGEFIFATDRDKQWMLAHIEAESAHNEKVSDHLFGMSRLAQTIEEQELMLQMMNDYCQVWSKTFHDFAALL